MTDTCPLCGRPFHGLPYTWQRAQNALCPTLTADDYQPDTSDILCPGIWGPDRCDGQSTI